MPRGSLFTGGGASGFRIKTGSPFALDSVARAMTVAMSWEVAMLWDRMWLEEKVQELLW